MAAPTNAANVKKALANPEPSTHEGRAEAGGLSRNFLATATSIQLRTASITLMSKPGIARI